jgi:hypothetical protein
LLCFSTSGAVLMLGPKSLIISRGQQKTQLVRGRFYFRSPPPPPCSFGPPGPILLLGSAARPLVILLNTLNNPKLHFEDAPPVHFNFAPFVPIYPIRASSGERARHFVNYESFKPFVNQAGSTRASSTNF